MARTSPWDISYTYTTPGYANYGRGITSTGTPIATPTFPTTSPSVGATSSTLAAAPNLDAISKLVNDINRAANVARVPQGQAIEEELAKNTLSEARGEVPQDVVNQLATRGAERGVGFGPDSPNANAAYLRALGLTSLDLTGRAQQGATAAYGRAAPLFDVSSMVTTPSLQVTQEQENARLAEQARQYALSLAQRQREFDVSHPWGAPGADSQTYYTNLVGQTQTTPFLF